jgi:hypothetical protein
MTLDGGWGLIIATVVGVMLVWVGNLIAGHFNNSKEKGDGAHERIDGLNERIEVNEREFLRFQTHIAETYARVPGIERMENNIFAVLNRLEAKVDKLQERGA